MNDTAILGYGTVGRGVDELLTKIGHPARYVFDLPSKKTELKERYIADLSGLLFNPEVTTVFECLGGDHLPYEALLKLLMAGKNVISSNKETISKHLSEYLRLAKKYHGSIQFEASVGGGIPLLNPLLTIGKFDTFQGGIGLLNGTSNFILSCMEEKQMGFEEALAIAQKKGFAERDPSADIDGIDLLRKGKILCYLLNHRDIPNESIPHASIRNLRSRDLAYLKEKGCSVKYGIILNQESVMVMPLAVKTDSLLTKVREENNIFSGEFENNGPLSFVGKGAGKLPTASAMIQDYLRVRENALPDYSFPVAEAACPKILKGRYLLFQEDTPIERENLLPEEIKNYRLVVKEEN